MFKILLIDDEESLGLFFADFIKAFYKDIQIVICDSWVKAKMYFERGESFDLIFLDQVMPNFSGKKIYAEIEKDFPAMKDLVVFMTGAMNFKNADCPYIQKPFDIYEIKKVIDDFIKVKV